MCLVVIAWRAHARYPLIVAGNRDEFHERPSASAGWWDDAAHVLGGRDLVAGGSWLAVSRSGRFAVVVNDPRRPPGPQYTASRGHLVREFVAGNRPSGRYLDGVAVNEARYAGFCLILGTRVQLRGFATSRDGSPHRWTLRAGVSALSNSPLDSPWPKVAYVETAMREALVGPDIDHEALFGMLGRREPVAPDAGQLHPASRIPFLVDERYGTRATTVVTMNSDGACHFEERRFSASGAPAGTTVQRFEMTG